MNTNVATAQTRTATAATAEAQAGLTSGQHGKNEPRPQADWAALLHEALTQPGHVSEAYRRFHSYSIGNALWVLGQCYQRGIELGPIATFNVWKQNGRMVRKGEHALMMAMPVTVHGKRADDTEAEDTDAAHPRTIFIARRNWFVLSQTDAVPGADPQEIAATPAPRFDAVAAVQNLGLHAEAFESTNGNCQGYSFPNRHTIAISPIAADFLKTTIHECAHCLLHSDEAQIRDGAELDRGLREVEAEGTAYIVCASIGWTAGLDSMRGYVQDWLRHSGEQFTQKNARRIFAAAAKILRAGTADTTTEAGRA
jgi:antirestriction protein ArdC